MNKTSPVQHGEKESDNGRKNLRVCMLSYSFYDSDARVSRYAETLVRRNDTVDIIAIGHPDQPKFSVINGVNVFRIQKRERNEKGKLSYLLRLCRFFIKSSVVLSRKHRENPYDVVHVHSVPDFEVFAAWLAKLKGARVILDIHDIVPEFYAAKFGTTPDSFLYKLLILIEKLSVGFADHVIISNHIWEKTLCRSATNGKCSVVMNYPDPNVFYGRQRTRSDDPFIMIYPGTLNWHQGLDIAIRAFERINGELPQAQLHIYGEGDMKNQLRAMTVNLGLQERVKIHETVPKERMAEIMSQADLGIVPKRNDAFGGEAFSTKILEFMSLGVPVIAAKTKVDRYYFNESVIKFFEPEDEASLAQAMIDLASNDTLRREQAERARGFVLNEYNWEERKQSYLDLVDRLAWRTMEK